MITKKIVIASIFVGLMVCLAAIFPPASPSKAPKASIASAHSWGR